MVKKRSSRWRRCELAIVPARWEGCIKMTFRRMCENGDGELPGGCAHRNRFVLHKPVHGTKRNGLYDGARVAIGI